MDGRRDDNEMPVAAESAVGKVQDEGLGHSRLVVAAAQPDVMAAGGYDCRQQGRGTWIVPDQGAVAVRIVEVVNEKATANLAQDHAEAEVDAIRVPKPVVELGLFRPLALEPLPGHSGLFSPGLDRDHADAETMEPQR